MKTQKENNPAPKNTNHGWIDVDDRLPELGQPVLVYSPSQYLYPIECYHNVAIFKGQYEHNVYDEKIGKIRSAYKWPLFEMLETNFTRIISHWMPLPPKPD